MKFVGKVFGTILGIVAALVLGLIYIAAIVISWLAAIMCGGLLILTFFIWLGYEAKPTAAHWHDLMMSWGYVGLAALIVFVIRGLPLLFVRTDPAPPRDEPFDPVPPLRLHL